MSAGVGCGSPRTLSVIHLTSAWNLSGGAKQAVLLCRGLVERGHRVLFMAPPDGPTLDLARAAGVPVEPATFGSLTGQWRLSRRLRALAAQRQVDVVHAHHTKGHNAALLATVGGGFPPIVANRGVIFRPDFPAKFRTSLTAAVIANSVAVKQVLVAARVAAAKVHVVYNAWDTGPASAEPAECVGERLRRELAIPREAPVVGAVASAKPDKGFQFLVEAAPQVLAHHPGAVFVLVGHGTETFLPRLAALGVTESFRLLGYRSDVADLMRAFDLFALPSIDMESCPNVVLEAMGAGLPVVGTAVGGVAELVEEGATGRIVPPGDAEPLALALAALLGDPVQRRTMGQSGRERVLARFSVGVKVTGTEQVYHEVLGR